VGPAAKIRARRKGRGGASHVTRAKKEEACASSFGLPRSVLLRTAVALGLAGLLLARRFLALALLLFARLILTLLIAALLALLILALRVLALLVLIAVIRLVRHGGSPGDMHTRARKEYTPNAALGCWRNYEDSFTLHCAPAIQRNSALLFFRRPRFSQIPLTLSSTDAVSVGTVAKARR
jgi:hypothetical protein